MEKILVIGGTGNIGRPLIQFLLMKTHVEVVAGVHNLHHGQRAFAEMDPVTVRHFDFLDRRTFSAALEGIDKVFFVRPPQLAKPRRDMWPFLKAVKQQGIKQLVFVSLLGVEKNPMTPHHKIEKMIQKLAIPHTFIRPSFFMQNLNTTHCYDIQKNHDLFIPAGHAKTSFIDTRDVGEVAGACLTREQYLNQSLDVTGPEALTYSQVAAKMTAILGRPITYSQPGLFKFRRTMIKRGMNKKFVNVMVMLYLITQLGNADQVNDTAAQVLGRPPRDLDTFIEDYQDDFQRLPNE